MLRSTIVNLMFEKSKANIQNVNLYQTMWPINFKNNNNKKPRVKDKNVTNHVAKMDLLSAATWG